MKTKLIGIAILVLALVLVLTLAPGCGKGKEEVQPGVTPTPGTTPVKPTPTPEAKTLKIGIVLPLSGPAAPWGMQTEQGAEWAVSRINAAGGIKAGADTYMISVVKCDDKYIGSEGATCATRMVYDERVHYIVGSIGVNPAMDPILTDGKCFAMGIGNADETVVGPSKPYRIYSLQDYTTWVNAFWKQVAQVRPDIKTVGLIGPNAVPVNSVPMSKDAVERNLGAEVVAAVEWTPGMTDFYPLLTPIVAKNPDAIGICSGPVGEQCLIVKQARELGFKGVLLGSNHGDPGPLVQLAGKEVAEGFYQNEPDYSSDIYPATTRALYAEFQQLYPGAQFGLCQYLGFSTMYFYKQAIEKAGGIDPDKVMTVINDPSWTYEWFGMPGKSLGGLQTFGIERVNQDETVLSTTKDGKKLAVSRMDTVVP